MPRTSQKTIAAKPKTNTRLSKKPPLTPAQLKQVDAWWRASNYLSACQLYLLDNPLLKRPLAASDLKQTIVGHWGTVPGQNFIYTHLNRVIQKDDLDMIYLSGPGHGGNAMVAQDWLDGTYTRGLSQHYPGRGRHAETVQAVLLPRRRAQPRGAGDTWLHQRGRRAWATLWPTPSALWRITRISSPPAWWAMVRRRPAPWPHLGTPTNS